VFVVFKKEAKDVAKALADHGFEAAALQGDMSQKARFLTLQRFRDGTVNVLVATDVAARGLDIPGVDLVVNYSLGTSIDMYIHRIGRCGRAGMKGIAHTFVIDEDRHLTPALVEVLETNRQSIPMDLAEMAHKVRASASHSVIANRFYSKDGCQEVEELSTNYVKRKGRARQQKHKSSRSYFDVKTHWRQSC